jgi:hypothetical protein
MRANLLMCMCIVVSCLVHTVEISGQHNPDGRLPRTSAPGSIRNLSDTPAAIVDRPELDAGRVFKGELAKYEFTITNQGSVPLEIIRVRSNCGCTTPTHDDRIEPGATGKISAELRTQSLSGKVQKTITVTTTDPKRPTLQLKLLATVVDVIQIESVPGNTLYPTAGQSLRESLLVHVEPAESLKITSVSATAAFVHAELRRRELSNARRQTYEVQLEVTPDAPFGRSEFAVVLGTDSRFNAPRIIELACEKGIVAPAQISFASTAAAVNGAVTQTCLLKSRDGRINILSLDTPGPYLNTMVTPLRDGAMQLVRVTRDASVEPGPGPRLLRINTDSPDQPLIEIPVVFSFEEERALARARQSSADPRPVRTTAASTRATSAASLLDIRQIRGRTVRGRPSEQAEHTVPVKVKSTEPLTITSASCNVPFITAEVQRDEADPQVYQVTLSIGPDAPFGRTAASLTLETDSPTAPPQIVPFFCEKGIVANTTSINLGTVRTGTKLPLTQACLLKNPGGPINIVSMKSTDPHVQVSAKPLISGSHQLLTLTCDGSGPQGSHSGKVLIETDDPHQPRLELEFHYQIAQTDIVAQP